MVPYGLTTYIYPVSAPIPPYKLYAEQLPDIEPALKILSLERLQNVERSLRLKADAWSLSRSSDGLIIEW